MASSILLTQCLQNDFVKPIRRYEPLPNRLHVGFAEALRLMGENPDEGPVARTMRWAYATADDDLRVVHIRDWHDPSDARQHDHLERFGVHCVHDTPGAEFAFDVSGGAGDKDVRVVDSLTLNDFNDSPLAEVLAPLAGDPRRVGLMGVWTEAKIAFLAYELRTRYPHWELGVCSALTAGSSRQHHFGALDHLERILGVQLFDSVGAFTAFLGGDEQVVPLIGLSERHPQVIAENFEPRDDDRVLIRYLFRDCREVRLKALDGGFSGNLVAGTESVDLHGHDQVPHVVKIGERKLIGQERTSFERIQEVLGNNAPQISDFADHGERGAIKYRYATMGGTFATTFQKEYMRGMAMPKVRHVLDTVFGEQLHRLYKAAEPETCDLLDYYQFDSRWSGSVRTKVEEITGAPCADRTIELLPGRPVANVCDFYEDTLAHLPRRPGDSCYQAFIHGDLNGANIILDGHDNVWLIDFFHTHRGHVLKDLIKIENDLLYIFTPLETDGDLAVAFDFTDALIEVADLGAPVAEPPSSVRAHPGLSRAWETLRILRGYYPPLIRADRDPFQLQVAQLRYAVHTLGFDESSLRQRKWALYTAGRCVSKIADSLRRSTELRVDWIRDEWTGPGKLGITLLPGRRDYDRDLTRDLAVLSGHGTARVVCCVPDAELAGYGVGELLDAYRAAGMEVYHLPILDQKACSVADARAALAWVDEALRAGEAVVLHCVGGLGRSGMIAGAFLRGRGVDADGAIAEVRRARSPRAIETPVQEAFIREYPV